MGARLQPGDAAPAFTLPAAAGSQISLSDFAGSPVVLYFYPAAMTPGCTKQACDFRDSLGALQAAGYAVAGVSPDGVGRLAEFRDRDGVNFPLLSDESKAVHCAYGAFGEKQLYGKPVVGVIRSTFVIDVDANGAGRIRTAMYGVKATGHVARLLRLLAS